MEIKIHNNESFNAQNPHYILVYNNSRHNPSRVRNRNDEIAKKAR